MFSARWLLADRPSPPLPGSTGHPICETFASHQCTSGDLQRQPTCEGPPLSLCRFQAQMDWDWIKKSLAERTITLDRERGAVQPQGSDLQRSSTHSVCARPRGPVDGRKVGLDCFLMGSSFQAIQKSE